MPAGGLFYLFSPHNIDLKGNMTDGCVGLYRVVVLQGKERIVMNMSSQDWLAVIQKEYVQNYLRQGGSAVKFVVSAE